MEPHQPHSAIEALVSSSHQGGMLLPICAWCKKVRDPLGHWHAGGAEAVKCIPALLTHGICPNCAAHELHDADEADQGRATR